MKLLKVDSVEQARQKLLDYVGSWKLDRQIISMEACFGRILAEDIYSSEDMPAFRRSTVDGYAVLSKDTAAAGESIPVFLTCVGQVEMGKAAYCTIGSGQCVYVPTGGMVPEGADAVVMVEYSEEFGKEGIALYTSATYGENIVQIGEETEKGDKLLERGKRLQAQAVGVLAAAGVVNVPVYKPLRLTLISTGDELVSPEAPLHLGQIRDVNTFALKGLAEKNDFTVVKNLIIPDDEEKLVNAAKEAMSFSDIVAISGGSSQGKKDVTRVVIDRISSPGVFTHGIALKPGKPTILGYDELSGTLMVGLPGHPVSAFMVFELLLCDLNRHLNKSVKPPAIPARVSINVPSSPGKSTCYPVTLKQEDGGYSAIPVFGKSGLITTLTRADGYFTIERDREGLSAGDVVFVHLF